MRSGLLVLCTTAAFAMGTGPQAMAQESPPSPEGTATEPGGMSPAPTMTLAPAPLEPATLSFLTFNPGLARGAVIATDLRLPQILEALDSTPEDVICLQEVWAQSDAEAIIARLADTHPHTFLHRTADESKATTPCGIIKTLRMSNCVTKKCEPAGVSIFDCVGAGGLCEDRYNAINDDCKRCLAANTTDPSSCAIGGAQDYAWEGHNGLLLLSKHPLEDTQFIPMEAQLVARAGLRATIGDYKVLCTHLSADLGMLPYPPGAAVDSWAGEHKAQLQGLSDAAGEGCTVLLGDLNTGPGVNGLDPELGENFQALLDLGFSEPNPSPTCTWCSDNDTAGGSLNSYIDHVLVRGCPETLTLDYRRTMDNPIEIEGLEGNFYLSDHFGVSATLSQ